MIFSELYSAYYNAIAAILKKLISGGCTDGDMRRTVEEYAFAESVLTIPPAMKSGRWRLMRPDGGTNIKREPTYPLTEVQRRWLKSLTLDSRMALFGVTIDGLDDVEPLFTPDDVYVYDSYADGDPYADEGYIERFRLLLRAVREKAPVALWVKNRRGGVSYGVCRPLRLEYSEKDDKFRLISGGSRYLRTVNLARIVRAEPYSGDVDIKPYRVPVEMRRVSLRVKDERNTLERAMLHFAHFEKQAEHTSDGQYMLHLKYDASDEAELVIRVLSFGPNVEVTKPDAFRALISDKLRAQLECGLK